MRSEEGMRPNKDPNTTFQSSDNEVTSSNDKNTERAVDAEKTGEEKERSVSPSPLCISIEWLLPDRNRVIEKKTMKLFTACQALSACFAGFAHGANGTRLMIAH